MRQIFMTLVIVIFFAGCSLHEGEVGNLTFKGEEWGPIVKGLQCRIWSDKTNYVINEPFRISFCLRNVGEKSIKVIAGIPRPEMWLTNIFSFEIRDEKGKEIPMVEIPYNPRTPIPSIVSLSPGKEYGIIVIPNESSQQFHWEIKEPGIYLLTGKYIGGFVESEDYKGINLRSNTITIRIHGKL